MNNNNHKQYKKEYKRKNKIITFPLSKNYHEKLLENSSYYDQTINTYVKNIVINFLNNKQNTFMSKDRQEFIKEYIRISRGVANNVNQIAYKVNIWEKIDINLLIKALEKNEREFKKFVKQVENDFKLL